MKLGGWWRLWVVLSGIYAVIVIAVTATLWPTARNVSHHPSFNYRISDASQKVLSRPKPLTNTELEQKLVDADRRGAKDEARMYALEIKDRRANPWKVDNQFIQLPNNHTFDIPPDATNIEVERIRQEYTEILNSEVWKERSWTTLYAFLWWLGPVVSVCILGILFRWVCRGFKAS